MFVGLSVLFLSLAAPYQAKDTFRTYKFSLEEIKKYASPWHYYKPSESKSPFECSDIGYYPDPYDCQSFYKCGAQPVTYYLDENSCNGVNDSTGYYLRKEIGCILAFDWCRCPLGTSWAGPIVGCTNDRKEIETCCRFKPDCVNSDGGDFGDCSLTSLGYRYSCRRDRTHKEKRPIIHVENFKMNGGIYVGENSLYSNSLQSYKVQPHCGRVQYVLMEFDKSSDQNFTLLLLRDFGDDD